MSCTDLLAYWRSKHANGVPPSRADLDPVSEIPKLVRGLMLVDCATEGYRFRLIGSDLVSRAGGDGTGRLVKSAPYPTAVLDRWIEFMDRAVQTREPQLTRSYLKGGGTILTLILPLVSANGSTEMLLGGAFPESATEGVWQPETIERLDIALLAGEASGSDRAPAREGIAGPNLTIRFQT